MNYKSSKIKLLNKMFLTFIFIFILVLLLIFNYKTVKVEAGNVAFALDGASSTSESVSALNNKNIQDSFILKNKQIKKIFKFDEKPQIDFVIARKRNIWQSIGAFFKNLINDEYKDFQFKAIIKRDGITQTNIKPQVKAAHGSFKVIFNNTNNLQPGKYEVDLELQDKQLTNGQTIFFKQNFLWGVLAFNTNKAIYYKNEEAYLQLAVLDEHGNTVCDAELEIEIDYPGWGSDILTTVHGDIISNKNCGDNNVINEPDYYVYYKLSRNGEYNIRVKAKTKNGEYIINNNILVDKKITFEIERQGPTRIFPKADYDMTVIIKANDNYQGEIIDEVPRGFHIYQASLNDRILNDDDYEYRLDDARKLLVWKNLDLQAGDQLKLHYYFDAPNVSPEFYLLGGLQIGDWQENRQWQIASDAVGSGIAWMTATSTTYSSDLNPSSAYALSWSGQDFDSTKYSYSDGSPSRLVVKEAGDYLVALSLPLYRIDAANNRTRIEAEFRVNNSKQDVGVARSSYIRNNGSHTEASNNMTVLLENLTANQYIEVFVRGITNNRSAVYISDQASMYVEKIESSRVVFSGTATETTNSTDLSDTTAYELEWTESREDTGFTHSDASSPEDITLDEAGDYLVSVNIPLYSTTARVNITANILLDAVAVNGGTFQQGYIRNLDADSYSSIHWVGVVQSSSANQVLSVSTIEDGVAGTVTVGSDKASIYVEKLADEGIYYGRGTNLSSGTNWNQNSAVNILWENDDIIDTNIFTHSTTANQHQITVNKAGDYLITYNDAMSAGSGRPNNKIEILVNDTPVSGAQTKSHYIRNSSAGSSASLMFLLTDLVSSDVIRVTTIREADNDTVNDVDDASLFIRYIDDRISPLVSDLSASQQADGSGLINFSFGAIDGNNDNLTAKVEYVLGNSCDFSSSLDPTISTTDASTTATYGDPDVSNTSEYQIGNPTNEILTSSGLNTIDSVWESATDLDGASSTYCVGLTLQDATGATSSLATTTVYIDNYAPQISSVIISDLAYAVGDTLTATITVATDTDTYSLANTTVNGVNVTNLQKINNTTYTFDYLLVEGNTDRASGTIPYVIILADSAGNTNSSFSGNFSNGSIDAHAPAINSVTINNIMFGIDDTITATISVTSDTDTYHLLTSTINGVDVSNLQKINNTTYTLDYVVAEGNTNRASGTIPYDIVLGDSYNNANSSFSGNFSNGSLDASRPVISSVYLTNGDYGIGDSLKAVIDADESGYDEFDIKINNKNISSFLDNGDSTYDVYYTVAEDDTDRAVGNIPISIILTDDYDNTNTAFISPESNTASVDAHKPKILSISLPNIAYKIGDIIQATTTVISDTHTYTLGTTSINTVVADNLIKVNDTTYTFNITVSEGDTDRLAGTIPVSVILKDQIGQYNNPASTTVDVNTASIDATYPSITNVSFVPSSGILTIGEIATATISLAGAETNATFDSATINGIDVKTSFAELGGGDYRLVYTVAEGNNDHADNDDLPVNIVVVDAAGNQADAYTVTDPDNRPGIDAHKPVISNVSFNITSGVLKVGDTATATISSDNTGYSAGVITINGVDVSSSLVDNVDNSYSVIYIVAEGHTDIADTNDLPVNISLVDVPGNVANAYTTADASNRPGVDAHTPTTPGNLSFSQNSGNSITVAFGATTTEANFKEYKIFYKIGTSGVTENDNEWSVGDDIDLGDILFNGTATTSITGLNEGTNYVINIWAYDDAGNKTRAVTELVTATNYAPQTPSQLHQLKNDGLTDIDNGNWTKENSIKLSATSSDPEMDSITLYYEFISNANSFITATTVPSGACSAVQSYASCTSKVWSVSSGQIVNVTAIPDSASGYKWQVLACDNKNTCSVWEAFNATTPNVKVDSTTPTAPGDLVEYTKDSTSIILTLGASSTEANFKEYKIFYKVGSSGVSESDNLHGSSSDINLVEQDYNEATSTLIDSLSAGTQYVANIWAYDQAGNKISANEITFTTDSASNPPTGVFNSVAEKTDGSGSIDISVEIDDPDNDDILRLKIEYVSGATCDFSSPLDPTLDTAEANISADYGDPDIDNNASYQVGTTSAYIWTSPGSNTINFDWLSAIDLPGADGLYCLRLTANDGTFDQNVAATTTIYIDNLAPTAPGDLSLHTKHTQELVLNFGATTTENNFSTYKIFYKAGTSGVNESDSEQNDVNLGFQNYNNQTTTTINNLISGTDYVFNIYAYDDYGNKASASEQSFKTNFIPANPSSLQQKKNDDSNIIANGEWTNEDNIRLVASVSDSDSSEVLSLYFEMRLVNDTLLIATSVPANACSSSTAYSTCSSHVWVVSSPVGDYSSTPFTGQVHPSIIPDSTIGYQWQVLACDDNNVCSAWIDGGNNPNFKVDTLSPSSPGNLSLATQTYNSLTLNFGASTSEANFKEYIIYYKAGFSGVNEGDTMFASTSDINLATQDYNSAVSATINGLLENTQYVINIWAYDEVGHKASATELAVYTNDRPFGNLLSATEKSNGSGAVDISISINDSNHDDSRAKLEYVAGASCNFASPFDPSLDEVDNSATSTYFDAKIENDNIYQIGNSTGWIITSSGLNTVNFDWLSQTDLADIDGIYCLRLTANDQYDDQAILATTTLMIDNKAPTVPGDLTLANSTGHTLTLSFGATTTENNFSTYKIFYKVGTATVNENDTEHIDSDLQNILFNGTATTTISGLDYNTQYSFKIYAYDTFGNQVNSGQTTFTTNAPPTGLFNSIAQKTNASGIVDISIEVYDVNLDDCTAKLEYVAGSACDFSSPLDPTLDESASQISSDYATTTINNSSVYQIGAGDKIVTNQGSNTINFDWSAVTDIGGLEGVYCLRLTVNDGTNDQAVSATSSFYYDDVDPIAPGSLDVDSVSGISVTLNFGLAGSDSTFKEYKIFYKEGTSGVEETDQEFNKNNDSHLGIENFGGASFTTVESLTQNTDYVFNIWVYDEYGNKASSSAETATTTIITPSASWRENEDIEDPTVSTPLGRGEHIRLRLGIANTGDWDIDGARYDLQYGIINGTCSGVSTWITIPATSVDQHFSMISSNYFSDLSSTTARLVNVENYNFNPGYIVEGPSSTTGMQMIASSSYTELEFNIEPTTTAIAGQKYCFRVTNQGELLDNYAVYPEFTLAPAPQALFVSIGQKIDGSEAVHIAMDVIDVNGDDSKVKIEYVQGVTCDFTTPLDPTLDEDSESISADYGTPVIDNHATFQIGTTTGWITTSYGTNTVAFDWDTLSDLSNADDTYCLRLTANDGWDNQLVSATTTVIVDHISPTTPGNLTVEDISSNSVTLGLGTTSSDTNFKEYKIFYKEGTSGVTESDSLWASSSDINLGTADFNTATTTEVTGLEVNKQYVFKIWAYDEFGHKAASSQEVSVVIRYVSRSESWRWYADQQNETPTTTLASENTAPIDVVDGSIVKLRLALREIENITGENIKIRLEYATFADFSDAQFVGEIGSTTALWRYGNGTDNDNDLISTVLLNGFTNGATHNESGISTTTYDHLAGTAAEWEFTIRANSVVSGNTYYFRAYDNTNASVISAGSSYTYPSLVVAAPDLGYSVNGLGIGSSTEGVLTNVSADSQSINFGTLGIDEDKVAAQRFSIDTNAGGGYQLFVYQRQKLLAGNGADIDPVPATNDNPIAWPINPSPSAFGYHAGDDTLSGSSPSRFSADDTYAAFEDDYKEISYSAVPVQNENVDFIYRVEAGSQQEAGDYQTEIVYILIPTFAE